MDHFYLKTFCYLVVALAILIFVARRRKAKKLPPQALSLPAKEVQSLADCPDLQECAKLLSGKYGKPYFPKKYSLPDPSSLQEFLQILGLIPQNARRITEVAGMLEKEDFTVYELRPRSLSEEFPYVAALYCAKETHGWSLELYSPCESVFNSIPEKFIFSETGTPPEPPSDVQ